jgi:nucleotide-binding universal stress UspA family protein
VRILQSILFATDFLPATQDVARVVVQLASVFDSHVTLLHALDATLTDPADLRHQRDQAAVRMRELVEQLGLDQIVVDEVSISVGSPADTVVRKAQEIDADLVLIGSGETSRFGRPAGPTAEAVLQHAHQPVLAVRPGEPSVQFRQILCPVDHSYVSCRGLQNAIRLARAFHGNLVALSVVPAGSWLPWGEETGTLRAHTEYERIWREEFESILQETDFENISWRKEIRTGLPHVQIAAAARDCCADVIVMGSTGRSGLARMLMGSVTRGVLQHLPCSLLTVKNEDVLEELLEEDIRTIKLLLAEGRELLAAERYAEAAAKFRQVVFQYPFEITALQCLAESYGKLGRVEEAARYRRRAAALHHEA